MLQKMMEGTNRNYVSLDDLSERSLAKTDPQIFFELHKPPILIDEVQYAPELFTYIKIYADTHHETGDFWLTGSQIFKQMNGAILENYVVSEIAKTYLNSGIEPTMYYYRDKDSKEIDVVLEQNGELNPIEIKKTSNPSSELTKVFSLLDKASVPRGKGAIVCMKLSVGAIDRGNYIIPVWVL